ncbi:MAG: hypothetical protein ROO76_18955 [Terriglobia bacterium]|nr:hypothetical protein [Terriglobia bacterium]
MMSNRDRCFLALIVLATFALLAQADRHSPAYLSMDRKVASIESNASNPPSHPQTTTITQDELNAYLSEGGIDIPKGLSDVKIEFSPGTVHASSQVDFDHLSEGHGGGNPIFSALFSGTHDVEADAQASGSNGQGTVTIKTVKLDGVSIPKAALEYLIQHYVKPKYPNAGMTSTFSLPDNIQNAVVQQSQVALTQK